MGPGYRGKGETHTKQAEPLSKLDLDRTGHTGPGESRGADRASGIPAVSGFGALHILFLWLYGRK